MGERLARRCDMAVTTLIVEDEPLARERLRAVVAAHDDLELVGEAVDGDTAIRMIDALRPELVFLDIELPGPKGLEVLQRAPSPGDHRYDRVRKVCGRRVRDRRRRLPAQAVLADA